MRPATLWSNILWRVRTPTNANSVSTGIVDTAFERRLASSRTRGAAALLSRAAVIAAMVGPLQLP